MIVVNQVWNCLQIWPQILLAILWMKGKIHKYTDLQEDNFRGTKIRKKRAKGRIPISQFACVFK